MEKIKEAETEAISMKEYKALQKRMKELEIENEILKKLLPLYISAIRYSKGSCPICSSILIPNIPQTCFPFPAA
ncbi:MAG: hypothetical protein ACOCNC_05780 [Acetivibrio ethanolgignens]